MSAQVMDKFPVTRLPWTNSLVHAGPLAFLLKRPKIPSQGPLLFAVSFTFEDNIVLRHHVSNENQAKKNI